MQSNDIMSRQSVGIHAPPDSPIVFTICCVPNPLETYVNLVKSAFCLGKAEKTISSSKPCRNYFLWCMNIVVHLSCYNYSECLLTLRKGRLDTRLFTPTPMHGTSQVPETSTPPDLVGFRMPRSYGAGHSEYFGSHSYHTRGR